MAEEIDGFHPPFSGDEVADVKTHSRAGTCSDSVGADVNAIESGKLASGVKNGMPESPMYISQETPDQTAIRLRKVVSEAELIVYESPYAFVETDAASFPHQLLPSALAFVRDQDVWSALIPSTAPEHEKFILFSFHFTPGLDNSGFVGWLASHLKQKLGTGVMVICGQNSQRGGIFDYWGAPLDVAENVIAELRELRAGWVRP